MTIRFDTIVRLPDSKKTI